MNEFELQEIYDLLSPPILKEGHPAHLTGPAFRALAQEVIRTMPTYEVLMNERREARLRTQRHVWFADVVAEAPAHLRRRLIERLIKHIRPHAPQLADDAEARLGTMAPPPQTGDQWDAPRLDAALATIDEQLGNGAWQEALLLVYSTQEGVVRQALTNADVPLAEGYVQVRELLEKLDTALRMRLRPGATTPAEGIMMQAQYAFRTVARLRQVPQGSDAFLAGTEIAHVRLARNLVQALGHYFLEVLPAK